MLSKKKNDRLALMITGGAVGFCAGAATIGTLSLLNPSTPRVVVTPEIVLGNGLLRKELLNEFIAVEAKAKLKGSSVTCGSAPGGMGYCVTNYTYELFSENGGASIGAESQNRVLPENDTCLVMGYLREGQQKNFYIQVVSCVDIRE